MKINPQPWAISKEKWDSYSEDEKFQITEKVRANQKILSERKKERFMTTLWVDHKKKRRHIDPKKYIS